MMITADHDDNGTGQLKAKEAAKACGGKAALPSLAGDWNDVWQAQGDIATQAQLTAFTRPQPLSPFEPVSEANLKAMSASQKAELLVAHYGQALAVLPIGEEICCYENGAWQIMEAKKLHRKIAELFQKVRAPFSAAGIGNVLDTLNLMVPQMGEPSRVRIKTLQTTPRLSAAGKPL